VARLNGYYFGLGGASQVELGLLWPQVELNTRVRLHAFGAPNTPGEELRVRLFDSERHLEQSAAWAPMGGPARLKVYSEQRRRVGSLNGATLSKSEATFGVAIGAVL
jgi:hypothetical protein